MITGQIMRLTTKVKHQNKNRTKWVILHLMETVYLKKKTYIHTYILCR